MAVLQSIRNRGKILVGAVGLALFAFIAEEGVRSFQSSANENRQKVGEVYGESLSVQDFNEMVEEFSEFFKAMRGTSQLDEQAMYQVREQAWQNYVQMQIVKHECDEVGLMVTDAEVQDVLTKGDSQILSQFAYMVGMNGHFDVNFVRQILDAPENIGSEQYNTFKTLWGFVEKRLREELLMKKFNSLVESSISNDIIAESSFNNRVNEWDVVVAALPYTSVADDAVEASDKDMQAKYEELKEQFFNMEESRSVEVISVKVDPSNADHEALNAELSEVAATIGEATNVAKVVRESGSEVSYSTFPVSRKSLPNELAACIDTMTAGQVVGPFYTLGNKKLNVVRLINKVSAPDSIEYRMIVVGGDADASAARVKADSILTAIKGGAPFDTIAAHKNQEGAKIWLTSAMYERQTIVGDDAKYIGAILEGNKGELQVVELQNACLVLEVTDRRNIIDKYDVAIVKRNVNFSKDTYTAAYNELSQFLAENRTADNIRENAPKKNKNLQTFVVRPNSPNVANVSSTREVLRWAMDADRKVGDVSQLYECGENDNLMVAILKDITPRGYMKVSNPDVDAALRPEVLKDKKAKKLVSDMTGKSFEEVTAIAGVRVDTVKHVSFANNMYVPVIGASESGVVGTLVGKNAGDVVSAVKGDMAVYTIKVLGTNKTAEVLNVENERNRVAALNSRMSGGYWQKLLEKANVVDRRYIFY